MAKGEEELHDQYDAAAAAAAASSRKKLYSCEICKKGFHSVYALNGHTRMHSDFIKPLLPSSSPPPPLPLPLRNNLDKCSRNPTSCAKPLFGHINTHPQIKPLLPPPPLRKPILSRRCVVKTTEITAAAQGDMFFTSWPVDCKRKRKRFSSPRHPGNSCSEHYAANVVEVEVDPLMEEAAYTLMLMANGHL